MKRRRVRTILCILLSVGIALFAAHRMLNQTNRSRMLRAVGLEGAPGLEQTDYAYWRDPLKYGDGYEIMAFSVDASLWKAPAGWMVGEAAVGVDEAANALGVGLNMKAILDCGLSGMNCSSCFFADKRTDRPFDGQDFYFACCDDTDGGNTVVFVYRGHHLYGL